MQIIHVNLANSLGGGEFQTLALMEALSDTSNQWLVHRKNSPLAHLAQQRSIRTVSACKAFLNPFAPCWNKSVLLHAHDGRGVHWTSTIASLHRLPYIITRRILKSPQNNSWTLAAYANASYVACVSQAVVNSMHNFNANLNTRVVYDGQVKFKTSEKCVKALRASLPDKIIVAQVGRLSIEKNVALTLKVARILAIKKLPIHFWIIGDGPLKESLLAAASDLENVEFLGHCSRVGNHLAAADILIHPSLDEAFGSVLIEAMLQNVVVLASRVGGIPEIVSDTKTGILVKSDDPHDFSSALERLCADPDLRVRLADGARQRAELFSLQKMKEEYLKLYHHCFVSHLGY